MKQLLCSILLMASAMSASAAYFHTADYDDVWFNWENTSHTWTFDLDNDDLIVGDIDAADTITDAWFTMDFYDDRDRRRQERADVEVDGNLWYDNREIDNFGDDIVANVTSLLDDHVLSVTVTRTRGDFGVNFSTLSGFYEKATASVPEPATLALLGFGLFGLGLSRRKLSA